MATCPTSDKIQTEAFLKVLLTFRDTKNILTLTHAQIYTPLISLKKSLFANMIFILHLWGAAWIQSKWYMNCPMKLRVHIGWIETEWHDHDLDGAVKWVRNSSTVCITMYHLTMKLRWKGSLFWEHSLDRGNWGEKRWNFLALSVLKACQLRGCCLQALAPTGKGGGWQRRGAQTSFFPCSI